LRRFPVVTEIPSGTVDSYEWAILEGNGYDLITTVVTVGPTLTRSLPYPGEVQRVRVRGRFIHIAYYALRDEAGAYQGTLEVSQDITELRALEGERRLLDEG